MVEKTKRLLPDRQVATRYGVSVRSIKRWSDNPDLGFPQSVKINGRDYRREDELDAFDAARMTQAGTN